MCEKPEFVLERLVHHVLREESAAARQLLGTALDIHKSPETLLAEILFPAAECMHQLRHDELISSRVFNAGGRVLMGLLQALAERLKAGSRPPVRRGRVLVMSAPGEKTDLGAQVMAALAEAYGFEVLFAGAQLSAEELIFACTRLEPEAVLVHGSLASSRGPLAALLERLRRAGVWPALQLAAVGTIATRGIDTDIAAANPMEVLELMTLCPEYRAARPEEEALSLLDGASPTLGIEPAVVREFLAGMFPPRVHGN